MLRRLPHFRRAEAGAGGATEFPVIGETLYPPMIGGPAATFVVDVPRAGHRRRVTGRRVALAGALVLVVVAAFAYSQRTSFGAQGAELSRGLIGDERTARIESWYFRIQDRLDRARYRVLGGSTNPFDGNEVRVDFVPRPEALTVVYYIGPSQPQGVPLTADIFRLPPLRLPSTRPLRDSPEPGEGVWTSAGLPRSTPSDMLMAKTFVRPDKTRPYALVGVLLIDSRRVRLHISAGTVDPGGDRGIKGTGLIPQDQLKNLLAAWNGGFRGPHGGYGAYLDGKEYRPLRNGLASIAVTKDGEISMGEWGVDLTWSDNFVSVRQNAVLLVRDGEVSKRTAEGNETWGYVEVDSSDFITWRSAVGLTKDGNLLVAAGNSLSAETLANALWAAGAWTAMQLDINNPYVLVSLFFPGTETTPTAERFMASMADSPSRFFKTQERDFMYVTLDDGRFR